MPTVRCLCCCFFDPRPMSCVEGRKLYLNTGKPHVVAPMQVVVVRHAVDRAYPAVLSRKSHLWPPYKMGIAGGVLLPGL